MVDPDSVQDYTPPRPRIEEVDGDVLQIYCGDDLPPIGAAVAIIAPDDVDTPDRLWAVVRRHLGARRVEAWLPVRPDWVRPEVDVEPTDNPAGFRAETSPIVPGPELLEPTDETGVPLWPTPPEYRQLSATTELLPVGIDPVDALAPLSRGGLNLVVDNSDDATGFFELARRAANRLRPDRQLVAGRRHSSLYDSPDDGSSIEADDSIRSQIAALQIAIALSAQLREFEQTLAIVELPDLRAPSATATATGRGVRDRVVDIVDRLGRHLVSTIDSELTALVLLTPPADHPGLSAVVDTLELGDADTTIFIDQQGRFDPDRSRSSADLDEPRRADRDRLQKTLRLADDADQKRSIFGDQELTDDERQALDEVDEIRVELGDSP